MLSHKRKLYTVYICSDNSASLFYLVAESLQRKVVTIMKENIDVNVLSNFNYRGVRM